MKMLCFVVFPFIFLVFHSVHNLTAARAPRRRGGTTRAVTSPHLTRPPPRSLHATLPVPGENEWEAASPPHVNKHRTDRACQNPPNVPLCFIDTTTGHRTAGSWHPPVCICKRFVYVLFIYLAPYLFISLSLSRRSNGRGEAGAASRMFVRVMWRIPPARWDGTHRTEARSFRWWGFTPRRRGEVLISPAEGPPLT